METPPVESSEILFRRIGTTGNPLPFDPKREPPLYQSCFLPQAGDSDGLSLIRARFRTAIWAAFSKDQPTKRYRLAEVEAEFLRRLAESNGFDGLTFPLTPDSLDAERGEPHGHCVAAEINRDDYDRDPKIRPRIKQWALHIVKALAADIPLGPFPEPTVDDPYRP